MRIFAAVLAPPIIFLLSFAVYSYAATSRLMDAQLHGERQRVLPRILARPLELRRGQSLSDRQLIDRLNDLGYAERATAEKPGEFAVGPASVEILPRSAELKGKIVRVRFPKPAAVRRASSRPAPRPPDRVERLELGSQARERLTLDAPVLSSIIVEREKRRPVALSAIPDVVVQAVLSIEDRRFYEHPGVDPIGIAGATFAYVSGRRSYLAGGSTITQQLVRNVFLPKFEGMTLEMARERSWRRKALEAWVSLVLSRRATKDEILEMYLNAVPLGQRGSFAIVGVSEAARLFFGKDVSNLSLAEAATVAGVIQSPSALSPFNNPERCQDRRDVVLRAMADAGFITAEAAAAAVEQPLTVVQRALESEAPHFVDYVGRMLAEDYPGLTTNTTQPVDVYTTLDLHLQRLAQDAVRGGLTNVDRLLSRRKRRGQAEAALLAVDPRTGEILAMVGGRSYNQSQYNRALVARRQPGSVFKPFVYLTAFEEAADNGQTGVSPASIVDDSPATWELDDQIWTPENYQQEYDGPITFRRALAHSRNVATIRVAEAAGYDKVAALWKRLGVGAPPKPYPSIALGVFEATPYEVALAYTIFPNMGIERPLSPIMRIERGTADVTRKPRSRPKTVARPETTFLVTNLLRGVMNEGTAAGARAAGFKLDAGGKTGTTNDLRDAWFVGFTPELLTVVWVGFDDNQPLGLSGSQAALPIWTQFMTRALAGRTSVPFVTPEGISFAEIDAATGKLAAPFCPEVVTEAFVAGTEPVEACDLHRF
ncbi:MAG: PBP1A family penicillin-binding protein [Luteitalea sp.]|nr:PBP1A family penicillin-binding protein [Luteitalea sp.]